MIDSAGTSKALSAAPAPRSMIAMRGWSSVALISNVTTPSKASA